jgi:hypothetical protein
VPAHVAAHAPLLHFRTGRPIDWVRWKRANENDVWAIRAFTDALRSGTSSATWIGLSFGNEPQ